MNDGEDEVITEMVDRVARAMYEVRKYHPFYCRQMARAAIAAMREPTDAMVLAGASELDTASEIETLTAYYAMIDAALKD